MHDVKFCVLFLFLLLRSYLLTRTGDNRGHSKPMRHLFKQITWTDEISYLRKPLRHPKIGETVFTLLQPCLQRAAHQGLKSLKPVLTGLRWSEPHAGLATQATMLTVIMHLFVPDTLKQDAA